ncbi:MAG: neutral zinc metallopeptidase [Gaiellaceae bacterium]
MRWKPRAGRRNIEDRRGMGGGLGRGGIPLPVGGGIGGLLVVVLIILFSSGALGGGGNSGGIDVPGLPSPSAQPGTATGTPSEERLVDFVDFVAEDVQDSWVQAFRESSQPYERTKVVIFENGTNTGCGAASSETGPFYCPANRKVYLDLAFFRDLRDRFGAPGDFAQAYVIAHEFGHHIQNVVGISDQVRQTQQENPDQANELSIKLELQADCLAGVWAQSAADEGILEPGDLQEGLVAAEAVGDDRIQKDATGRIDRESWTHGSSQQRMTWFRRGFDSGDTQACDSFGG